MRSSFPFTLTLLQLVDLSASSSTSIQNLTSRCQKVANNPTWQIKDFTFSNILTGGSDSSLSHVTDITFSLNKDVMSSSATCTTHDNLDKGQMWDPKVWHKFEFDISNNNPIVTQAWGCAFGTERNMYV